MYTHETSLNTVVLRKVNIVHIKKSCKTPFSLVYCDHEFNEFNEFLFYTNDH